MRQSTSPGPRAHHLLPDELAHLHEVANRSLFTQFAELCEGALIVDRQARVVWMNEKYPLRLGLRDPAAAIGQPVEAMLPNSQMREVVESGRPIMLDIMDFGSESFVVLRLPLRNEQDEVIGGIGLMLLDDAKGLAPLVSRYHQLHRELADTRSKLAEARRAKYTLASIVGHSHACLEVKSQARRAARTGAAVLIQGETGTGKELLAQAIHNASLRADKPFVAVNIAAVPESLLESEFFGAAPGAYTGADRKGREGKFRLADGGTLFLDEIGDMPTALQAKLLRVLQEGEYEALGSDRLLSTDVRIVAATSRDLSKEVQEGRFRADLYYRLNVVTLTMPPLRERMDDLPLLCEYLLDALCQRMGMVAHELSAGALEALRQHRWPGNIRELQNVLERALMMADTDVLQAGDIRRILGPSTTAAPDAPTEEAEEAAAAVAVKPLSAAIAEAERQAIRDALRACDGNKARAASLLGISRTSFYEKLSTLQI
ncbi:MAG: sigma 54-interacting transcriptional regulator [Curvibacter sp.]|nr:sigma 54-interacting transcriptional regulator [Curvibacter sp.]